MGCKNDPARSNGFWAHDNLVVDNVMNGEGIRGCELPDDVVYCANYG